MSFFTLLLIAVGLCFDSFAVSVCSGLSYGKQKMRNADVLKISLSLAIFQAMMPVLGWILGSTVKEYIEAYDHWIALALLSILGIRMIKEGLSPEKEYSKNPAQWKVLIPMSIGTSIDALAVGITFSFWVDNMFVPALTIGIVTLVAALMGIYTGKKVGARMANKAGIIGGIILIIIGIKIVIEHVWL